MGGRNGCWSKRLDTRDLLGPSERTWADRTGERMIAIIRVQAGGILNLGRELCVTRGGLLVSLDSPEHSRIDFIARSTKQRGVEGGK